MRDERLATAPYPVRLHFERPPHFSRMQLLLRLVALFLLGILGLSFGAAFAFAYLALPILAALRLSSLGSHEAYLRRDGRRVLTVLHWFAALSAWAGLVAERLPAQRPGETVALEVELTPAQTSPGSALARIITGLPSAIVLTVLGWVGILAWLLAALMILLNERVGPGAFHYLSGLQRWSIRLLAYQACLVDEYPPFSLSDSPPVLPEARAGA